MNTQMLKDLFVLLFTDRLYLDIIIRENGASVEISNLPESMSHHNYKLVGEVDDIQDIFSLFEREESVATIHKDHISMYIYDVSSLQLMRLLNLIEFNIIEIENTDLDDEEED